MTGSRYLISQPHATRGLVMSRALMQRDQRNVFHGCPPFTLYLPAVFSTGGFWLCNKHLRMWKQSGSRQGQLKFTFMVKLVAGNFWAVWSTLGPHLSKKKNGFLNTSKDSQSGASFDALLYLTANISNR